MAINIYKTASQVNKGEWYDIAVANDTYTFPIANFATNALVLFRAYSKAGNATPIFNVSLLDSSNGTLKSVAMVDVDSGSTVNFSEVITEVPAAAVRFRLSSSAPIFLFAQPIQLSPYPPLTPIRYLTSQEITLSSAAEVALLGGGGGGGGTTSAGALAGGGGSGYMTTGNLVPGTYTMTIGLGGAGSTGTGSSGGTTSIGSLTAAGGNGGQRAGNGGSGGSGGGVGSSGAAAGFNGNSGQTTGGRTGGAGSGAQAAGHRA